jgi:hypothetical protein
VFVELEWAMSLKGREKKHLMAVCKCVPGQSQNGGNAVSAISSLLRHITASYEFQWSYASHVLSEFTTSLYSFNDYFLVFLATFPAFELLWVLAKRQILWQFDPMAPFFR